MTRLVILSILLTGLSITGQPMPPQFDQGLLGPTNALRFTNAISDGTIIKPATTVLETPTLLTTPVPPLPPEPVMAAIITHGALATRVMLSAKTAVAKPALVTNWPTVELGWVASTSTNVAGYNLNIGTNSGQYPISIPLPATPCQVWFVAYQNPLPAEYFFAVSAFDAKGDLSPNSNEIAWTP